MTSSQFALAEILLTVVVVVGFCAWQWITLKRDMRATAEKKRAEAEKASGGSPQ